jgi:hypothetical protein
VCAIALSGLEKLDYRSPFLGRLAPGKTSRAMENVQFLEALEQALPTPNDSHARGGISSQAGSWVTWHAMMDGMGW